MDEAVGLARRLQLKGPAMLKQLRQMAARLLGKHHAAATLFLDDGGKLTQAATAWMQQLAADNFVNGGAWHMDPREHAFREGKRTLALEIINSARLDVARLEALTKLEREIE